MARIATGFGRWIRPVSDLDDGKLLPHHYTIGGYDPQLLDVVEFEHDGSSPDPSQPENVDLLDSAWRLASRLDPAEAYEKLSPYLVAGPELLGGRGPALNESEIGDGIESSLALVEPHAPEFLLKPPWQGTGRSRPRVTFQLDGCHYDLPLTDFVVRRRLAEVGYGSYGAADLGFGDGDHVLLTASLGSAWRGSCWKLAAAVMFLA